MKLLLFILGITLITASPTLRGLLSINLGESGENTEGIFVVFEGQEDANADLPDNFSFNWNFGNDEPNNGESGESNLEQALEEENIILSEEESLPDLLTQVRNDPVTSGILDFGVSTVIASGIEKGKIPNITFTVTSISALATTTSDQGNLYNFSCEANGQNGNSTSVIDMNFTVYYDFASERRILSAYSFVITTTTVTVTPSQPSGPQNGYVQVSEADIETDVVVQDVLEYGIAQIYTIGTQAGNIPASEFVMAKIVSVWKQVTNTGANYHCEVVLDNKNNVTVNANFTVAYVADTQQSTLTSYQYTVSNIIVTPPSNNTNTTTPSQPTNTTTNSTTPVGNNNSTNTTTNVTVDGFTALSADEIQSAPVQAALGYGVNQILENGYAKGKIPVSQYNIANVSSVLEKIVGKITTYRFAVVISGDNKANISAIFDVFLQNSNFSMGGWTYNITTIRNATNPTNSTNTTTPTQPTNTTNSTTPTGPANTTTPTQPTNTTTNSTTPTGPTNTTNTTTPVGNNNSTNTTTNVTTDGFTALSADEIQSAPVQAVLNYGVNQILQNGYAKGKIPVSQYNITNVSSVLKKIVGKITTYRCTVIVSGANKANISALYDVFVQNANYSMGGWTYNITTIRNATNPTNSTNTTTPTQPTNTTTGNSTTPTGPANTTTPTQPANNTNTTTPTQPTNTTTNSTTPTGPSNTTTPTQPTNTTNTTTPVGNNNSTNTTTNATTGGFTALSATQIQSAQVQAVLAYGTNQLIQSGNAKGKIPVSVYNITKVNSVLMKAEAKSTLYESDVVLQDANNVTIAAVFNVSVNAATHGLFVDGWTYTVTNIKKPQNNTNTTATTAPTTSPTNTTSVNTNNSTNTNTNTTSTPNTINTANTTNTTSNTTSANNTTTPAVPITPVATNNSTNTTGITGN